MTPDTAPPESVDPATAKAPTASVRERLRVAARQLVGTLLGLVPVSLIHAARRRHVLVGLLRHRSIAGLGQFTVASTPPVELAAIDSRLVRMLFWYGEDGYEGWEAEWWRRFCRHSTGILEIGANIGYYTVHGALAAPQATYTAVEANPESADIVRRNLALNHIEHVRVLACAAVGDDASGPVELALPALEHYVAPTGAYLMSGTEGVAGRRPRGRRVVVESVPASSLVEGVDLIKLDIEGAEHTVLESTIGTLAEARAVILVEVLRDTPLLRELLCGLVEHDYRFWIVAGPELRELAVEDLRDTDLAAKYGSRDIAAIPESRRPALLA